MGLSADRNTPTLGAGGVPVLNNYRVKGSTVIYKGALVALDSSGYLVPGSASTTLDCAGMAIEHVDNGSGSDGALNCQVMQGGSAWDQHGTTITAAHVGEICYIYDDHTVTLSSAGASPAGTIYRVDSAGVWVVSMLPLPSLPVDLSTFESSLASTANGAGASLVGIEDAAGYYGAATVEAALVELTEEPIYSMSSQVTLSTVANSDVVAAFKPGFKCKIINVQFTPTIAVSTSAKAATLTTKINTTAVTGGVLSLTSDNCNTKGTQVAGTAVTALNSVIATDTVNIVASSVTTFVEGEGMIYVNFGRA